MNLSDVMDELGNALDLISGLRVFRYPPDTVTPPAAIVSYPDSIRFDSTYGRGMDQMIVPVVVVVGRVTDRASKAALGVYCNGSGAKSVKAAIDGYGSYTALHVATVTDVDFDSFTIGAIDYIGATFLVDVAGTGT